MRWYLLMASVCVSLMSDLEQHLLCLLAIWVIFGKISIQPLCPFYLLDCCFFVVEVLYLFWILTPYGCDLQIPSPIEHFD